MIKSRILIKQGKGLPLSERESFYLVNWQNNAIDFQDKSINIVFNQLSAKDKTLLSHLFEDFSLEKCGSFFLNELLLELHWFVNVDRIHHLDQEYLGKTWGIHENTYDHKDSNKAYILAREANYVFNN